MRVIATYWYVVCLCTYVGGIKWHFKMGVQRVICDKLMAAWVLQSHLKRKHKDTQKEKKRKNLKTMEVSEGSVVLYVRIWQVQPSTYFSMPIHFRTHFKIIYEQKNLPLKDDKRTTNCPWRFIPPKCHTNYSLFLQWQLYPALNLLNIQTWICIL